MYPKTAKKRTTIIVAIASTSRKKWGGTKDKLMTSRTSAN